MDTNNFRYFTSGIARTPPLSMAAGITTQKESVDIDLARQQHQAYFKTLQDLGIRMSLLQPAENFPDSHFVEDAAIIYGNTAILTRPGALERRGEVSLLNSHLPSNLNTVELDDENHDATVDGGDVLMMGDKVFIGLSYRTNLAGAQALSKRLKNLNPQLNVYFIEFSGVLHLKSGLIALNDDVLLGNPYLKLKNPFPLNKIIWLPKEEGYAANALVVNGAALVFKECTHTQEVLKQANLIPIPLDLSEFRKMDGSFTCLSLLM